MAVSTQTASELTQEQVQSILVQPLEAKSIFLAASPLIFDTDGSPVRVPTLGAATNPAWHGENEQITEQDVDFGEIELLPSGMKSIKSLTRFSNELARQSVVALDSALQARLVKDVADKMDAQLLSASGDGVTTPRGLFAYEGVQNLALGGAVDVDDLHDAYGLALGENVDTTRVVWIMNPAEFTAINKLKTSTGEYLVGRDVTEAGRYQLLGAPVFVSNHVPAGSAALVDFAQIGVARDVAPAVKLLDQTFGDFDQLALRVVYRMDAKPLNAKAVVTLTGIGE